jgi:hypothetical protein
MSFGRVDFRIHCVTTFSSLDSSSSELIYYQSSSLEEAEEGNTMVGYEFYNRVSTDS